VVDELVKFEHIDLPGVKADKPFPDPLDQSSQLLFVVGGDHRPGGAATGPFIVVVSVPPPVVHRGTVPIGPAGRPDAPKGGDTPPASPSTPPAADDGTSRGPIGDTAPATTSPAKPRDLRYQQAPCHVHRAMGPGHRPWQCLYFPPEPHGQGW
jgi:hypothetical protein